MGDRGGIHHLAFAIPHAYTAASNFEFQIVNGLLKMANGFLGQKNGHEMRIEKVCQTECGVSLPLLNIK
ncbi:MAG: hypothetical protein J7M27_04350 [Candidatus Latescibacteria bacterium]|nr:hypothetical protein [Candidatus Latescibacterota bacterium]